MSSPFIGEIRMFAGTFAPRQWAFCDGQLMPVSGSPTLFSLLGNTYGGDGRTTFGLPDLRGRVPLHYGAGPGLTPRDRGQKIGTETETLSLNEMPNHNHSLEANSNPGDTRGPVGDILARSPIGAPFYNPQATSPTTLSSKTVDNAGGGAAHANMMPFLAVQFIISLDGLYPSRN